MHYKLVLYGAGKRCRKMCNILKNSGFHVAAVIDSDPLKWGNYVDGYLIESPEVLKQLIDNDVRMCITIADEEEAKIIREELIKKYCSKGILEIGYDMLILAAYKENRIIRKYILDKNIVWNRKYAFLFDCADNGLGLGGIEAWTVNLCSALIKKGWEETYILSKKGVYQVPRELDNHIVYVDRVNEQKFTLESVINVIKAIIKKLPCTVVTAHVNEVMIAAYVVKNFYSDKIKIISVIHEGSEKVFDRYLRFRECTDIYVGVSDSIKQAMIDRGVEEGNIYSMLVPFDCGKFLDRSYTEKGKDPICIGYAGRMSGFKNSPKRMDLILRLVHELENKKVKFKMELAGDGAARKDMETFIDSHHFKNQILFLGKLERSELSLFWKRQDICINVSDSEGRSISILEAMANGAVPLVTNTNGVNQDIIDSINGYIVPIGDYCAMAERIMYLADHREKLSVMGSFAHETVYPKSGMEAHLQFWESILLK